MRRPPRRGAARDGKERFAGADSTATAAAASHQRVLDTVAIDRYSHYVKRIELHGVEALTVTVANGDGRMWWDWFVLGVQARA